MYGPFLKSQKRRDDPNSLRWRQQQTAQQQKWKRAVFNGKRHCESVALAPKAERQNFKTDCHNRRAEGPLALTTTQLIPGAASVPTGNQEMTWLYF
jgi:hypothetical protein